MRILGTVAKFTSAVLVVSVCFFSGCGGGGADVYSGPFGTVQGKLTFNGNTLPEGTSITFTSVGEKTFVLAAKTDANGEFSARWNGGKNIPVGEYKVSVTQPVLFTETDPDKLMEMSEKGLLPKGDVQFNPKYTDPGKSGLQVTVTEGENTPLTIELD